MQISDVNRGISAFALEAERLVGKGLSPLPITSGSKRPAIKEWGRYCSEQPSLAAVAGWNLAFSDAGLGVALGTALDKATNSRLVAVDIDQDAVIKPVKALIFGNQPNGWPIYIGKRGKRGITVFARSTGLLPGQKITNDAGMAVELLSRGQQTVIPPTVHPDTHEPYRWLSKHTLLNADLLRLPVITPELWQQIKFAVSSPIGGTHTEGTGKIRYLGQGRFEGVEMVYPGNVNDTQWKMAGVAARYHFYRGDDTPEAREVAVDAMVQTAMEVYRRSGSVEAWDREKQWQEAASQYDRQLERLYKDTSEAVPSGVRRIDPASEIEVPIRSRPSLEIIKPTDFYGRPLPERRWLVDQWVPYGEVVSLYGDGGIGKSLLSLQLMTACALGQPWLGLKTMPCSTFGLFCEDDRDELIRRTAAIAKHYGAELRHLDQMTLVSRVGEDNFLMTFVGEGSGRLTDLSAVVKEYLVEHKPGLIVIDTAADTFGGNENIRAQVRQFIAQCMGGFARSSGGTVLLCAHPSRAGLGDGSGTGGSTAWNNSVRARLYLRHLETESKERLLSRKKSNYGPIGGDDIPLDWKDGTFIRLDGQGADAILNRVRAKELFLAGLDHSAEPLSPSVNSAYYAPKKMTLMPEVENLSVAQLAAAMSDLIREKVICVEEVGPKSKRRKVLVRMAQQEAAE